MQIILTFLLSIIMVCSDVFAQRPGSGGRTSPRDGGSDRRPSGDYRPSPGGSGGRVDRQPPSTSRPDSRPPTTSPRAEPRSEQPPRQRPTPSDDRIGGGSRRPGGEIPRERPDYQPDRRRPDVGRPSDRPIPEPRRDEPRRDDRIGDRDRRPTPQPEPRRDEPRRDDRIGDRDRRPDPIDTRRPDPRPEPRRDDRVADGRSRDSWDRDGSYRRDYRPDRSYVHDRFDQSRRQRDGIDWDRNFVRNNPNRIRRYESEFRFYRQNQTYNVNVYTVLPDYFRPHYGQDAFYYPSRYRNQYNYFGYQDCTGFRPRYAYDFNSYNRSFYSNSRTYFDHLWRYQPNFRSYFYFNWIIIPNTTVEYGFYNFNSMPYYSYQYNLTRYSQVDSCNIQLVDRKTWRVGANFFPDRYTTCFEAVNQCSDLRDRLNQRSGRLRFECLETFRESSYQYFNYFRVEDYLANGDDYLDRTLSGNTEYYYNPDADFARTPGVDVDEYGVPFENPTLNPRPYDDVYDGGQRN